MRNMPTLNYLKNSLQRAISRAGNMRRLAEERGMDYSTINRFNSGRNDLANMPVKTLIKLFPELTIYCFDEDDPHRQPPPPSVADADIIAEISDLIRQLPPREKLKLLTMVAATYGSQTGK